MIIRNGPTTEKRRIIDIKAAREAYSEEIIYDIIWIRRKHNLADEMKKDTISKAFVDAIQKWKIYYKVDRYMTKNKLSKNEKSKRASVRISPRQAGVYIIP